MALLGVAEQFAIAEAKLRAWASIDDDYEEDSNDEETLNNGQTSSSLSKSSGIPPFCSFPSRLITYRPHFCIVTETPTSYPSISRCSDFLLLPQTPPRPIQSQERRVRLK